MNYNKLYYFYQTAKASNLTHTAGVLHISQPSLSKAIKDLEDELGVLLFERTSRSLSLTQSGELLYQECAPFFKREAEIIHKVRQAGSHEAERVRLGYMMFNTTYGIYKFIRSFQMCCPDIVIEPKIYTERSDIDNDLLNGKLDVGIKLFTMDELIPPLGFRVMEAKRIAIIVPEDHSLAQRDSVDFYELRGENIVSLGCGEHSSEYRSVNAWCQRCGFEPHYTSAFDRVESVLAMVQSGEGIAILSEFAPLEHMVGLKSIPLNNGSTVHSGVFWKKDALSPAAKRVIDTYWGVLGLPTDRPVL